MATRLRTLAPAGTLGRRGLLGGAQAKLGDSTPADVELADRPSIIEFRAPTITTTLGTDLTVGPPPPPPINTSPDAGGDGAGGPGDGDGSGGDGDGGTGGDGDGTGTGPGGPGGAE